MIFKSGWTGYAGDLDSNHSANTLDNATRSPIVALLNNISATDTYRIEVVYTAEYIPTAPFSAWTETTTSPLSTDVIKKFSKNVMENIGPAISGLVGRELGTMSIG
jgi:hypothetical protein